MPSKIRIIANTDFKMLRLRLLKIAARIIEAKNGVGVAFATACPDAVLFRGLTIVLSVAEHDRRRAMLLQILDPHSSNQKPRRQTLRNAAPIQLLSHNNGARCIG